MIAAMASINERFRQDRYERRLYGESVVDAYIDLWNVHRFIGRRLGYLDRRRRLSLVYVVLRLATQGGING